MLLCSSEKLQPYQDRRSLEALLLHFKIIAFLKRSSNLGQMKKIIGSAQANSNKERV